MSAEILAALAEIKQEQQRQNDTMAALGGRRSVHGAVPAAPPAVRRGENIMGSRGFMFKNLVSALRNRISYDDAKIELEFCDRFTKCMKAQGWSGERGDAILAPFWPEAFPAEVLDQGMYLEAKSLLDAGASGADPNEMMEAWRAGKSNPGGWAGGVPNGGFLHGKTAVSPAMSWVDQSIGGSFVGPPTFGPPIELARNTETLMQVATIVPLGPTGQITMPRLTQATQGGWLGENDAKQPATPGTGSLNLRAKKTFAIVVVPGESQRYAAPALEQLVRNDMFKTCALVADMGFLTGSGSDKVPQGILTGAGMTNNPLGYSLVTPSTANQLSPQDINQFLAAVAQANGTLDVFLMNPVLFYAMDSVRETNYSGGANTGLFVVNPFSPFLTDAEKMLWRGRKVIASNQVPLNRGSGNQTAVIGGKGDDFLIGMFGAIEFSATDQGWTLFSADQIAIRAILSCDGGARHTGWWAIADALNQTVGP